MKTIITFLLAFSISTVYLKAQSPDTVIVKLANTTQLTITMEDQSDLDVLKHYDFEALFEDILARLDTSSVATDEDEEEEEDEDEEEEEDEDEEEDDEEEDDEEEDDEEEEDEDYEDEYEEDYEDEYEEEDNDDCDDDDSGVERGFKKIRHFFNADFGINNYAEHSAFLSFDRDQYTVRPWGSWNIAVNSVFRTRVNQSLLIEWGPGVSWYNFKFEDEETLLLKSDGMVSFVKDPRDFVFNKSKLTVTYINLSVIPVIEFGDYRKNGWKSYQRAFRVGAGLYGGYRLGSYTKQVYDNGERSVKQINHDSFYLNTLRYGVRLQFGVFDTDFFINYDLNKLFEEGRGPELNAYSFGIVF